MIFEYFSSLFFVCVVVAISCVVVLLNSLFVQQTYDAEKNSAYECGFQPIDLNLQQFEIKYYVVGLLFLVFDVEIAFIIPFINIFNFINLFIVCNFLFFVLCFLLTFFYEWKNYYLEWE